MKKLCILFFSLLTFVSFSQTLEVVYSETTDLSDEFKNLDLPEMEGVNNLLIQQLIQQQASKPVSFKLTSSQGKSLYESFSKSKKKSVGGISLTVSRDEEQFFRDFEKDNVLHQTELLSRQFIIDDTLRQFGWKVSDETKTISGFECKKAVSKTSKNIEAWYTSEISLSVGPRDYHGLPGLIMEVNVDSLSIVASEVKLIEENTDIEAPTEGKKVSREKYNKIMEKKMGKDQGEGGVQMKVITM